MRDQELFEHMNNEHGLTLLESEMDEIKRIVFASPPLTSDVEIEEKAKEYLKIEYKKDRPENFTGYVMSEMLVGFYKWMFTEQSRLSNPKEGEEG